MTETPDTLTSRGYREQQEHMAWLIRNEKQIIWPEGFEGPRPVSHLQVGLHAVIVGAEQRRESRCVARAAQVLHQERVEERRALLRGQTQDLRKAHPDETRPHRVPFPLPFGQVQCAGESRKQLGEAQVGCLRGLVHDCLDGNEPAGRLSARGCTTAAAHLFDYEDFRGR